MTDCIIGLLYQYEGSKLVTLKELKHHISDTIQFNSDLSKEPIYGKCKDLYQKVWTLKDYADRRRSTNLTRFAYCPDCGVKIHWKAIWRDDNG